MSSACRDFEDTIYAVKFYAPQQMWEDNPRPPTPSNKNTPDLRESHGWPWRWLRGSGPLDPRGQLRSCRRITFKTAVLVYKCLHGMAPPYLSTYCKPMSSHGGRCNLRSAESSRLTVPRSKTNYGDRGFAVYGPVVWNSLPAELRLLNSSLSVFRKRLKTFLFEDNC